MRRFYLVILAQLAAMAAWGQTPSQYLFSNTTATYATISGQPGTVTMPTAPVTFFTDDQALGGYSVGFPFHYCGVDYSTYSVSTNGWLSFGGYTAAAQFSNTLANANTIGAGTLLPLWDDWYGINPGAFAGYQVSGTAPTRVFTFEWGPWSNSGGAQVNNFQIKLYESSNAIEYRYGTSNMTGRSISIGLSNGGGAYYVIASTTTPVPSSTTFSTTNITAQPAANTSYRWIPPPGIAVSPASLTFSTGTGTNSAGQPITVRAWGLTSGSVTITAPTNFQVFNGSSWVSSMTVSTSAAAVGTYINQDVQVRFVGPGTPGPYSGTLTISSTGATTQNVTLNGTALLLCSGTPAPGTVSATATTGSCTPYTSTLSTPSTVGIGSLTFQWESSATGVAGSFTPIPLATNATYVATVSSNIYYRNNVTCQVSGISNATPGILLSYNAPPTAITGTATVCQGSTTTFASTPTTGATWSSSNGTVASVNSAGLVTGLTQGTANIIYTITSSGCNVSRTVTVNAAPALSVTPALTTVCAGGSGTITATLNTAGSPTATSGPITGAVIDNTLAPAVNTLSLSGIPAGATITGMTVTVNATHSYVGDVNINLQAPGGSILNLFNLHGGGGDNWSNTVISSNGVTTFASSAAPYTGTFAATGASAVGTAPYVSNVTNFSGLYGTPNGNWTIIFSDHAAGDVGTIDNWGVTMTYTMAVTNVFSPIANLYTNAALTTPYTGANITTVYANPTSTTVYTATATATATGCTRTATRTFSVNPLPAAIGGPNSVCETRTITLTNAASGTWVSSTPAVATVTASGSSVTVTGVAAGTTTITFTASGCSTTKVVTVMATPPAITSTTSFNVCEEGTVQLTNADGGTGTWTSATPGNATVGLTSGIVTGVASGTALISYTALNSCVRTRELTVNPLPVVTVTPPTATICENASTTITASSPAPQMTLMSQDFNTSITGWTVTNVGSPDPGAPWQLATATGSSGMPGDGSQYLQAYSQGAPLPVQTTITSPSFHTMGGFGAVTLTFNQTLLSFAPPDVTSMVEYSVNGGAWNTLVANQAGSVINDGGTWTAANPQVTIDLPAGAIGVNDVRLRWVYNGQSLYWLIDNISVKGTMPASGFTWSGPAVLSCTNCPATTISPIATGANLYNVATTTSAGCIVNTPVTVTVNDLPDPISGGLTVCEGVTNMLTSGPGSGTWSEASSGAIASIVSGTGALTGVAAGNTTVTFTETSTGCQRTGGVTVLVAPAPVTPATAEICVNNTIALNVTTPGGVWSSGDASVASVSPTGVVTGLSDGVVNITYTISSGCVSVRTVTVHALPGPISGNAAVCMEATTPFTSTTPFGTWTSANSVIASVDGATGTVLGVNAGNTTITYTLPTGCYAIKSILVNNIPLASGPSAVCQGQTAIFSGGSTGATWSSSAPAIASINSSGVVTTNNTFSGTLNIMYTFTAGGCVKVMPFTVNTRAAITGPSSVCEGATATLANIVPDGTWASANDLIATIDPMTGVVTGQNAMPTTITYTTPVGCVSTRSMIVNPLPATINGPATICENGSVTLSNSTPMGVWNSSNPGAATISSFGDVTAMSNNGTTLISYTLISTGCRRTHSMTVVPLPDAITGNAAACANNGTTQLFSAPSGGTWSSSNSLIASATAATGVITGHITGNAVITYMLPTGCFRTASLVVNPLPNSITGTASVCENANTDLNNSTPNGAWSSLDGGIASVDATTGLVHGENDGMVGIVYTLPTGCSRTRTVTVNVVPDAFTGNLFACPNQTSQLFTSPIGGTWSAGTSAIASVNSSGIVSAHVAGNTNISYTMPTGCRTVSQFTVNPLPSTITGVRAVCVDGSTTLSNGVTGGTWSITNPTLASVDVNSGVVDGHVSGITSITYQLPTGCLRAANLTVNALPAGITGASSVCQNSTTTLSSATSGGTWTSANASIATIGATTGTVLGVNDGIVNISYTLPTGCRTTMPIEVMPLPADITGPSAVCVDGMVTMFNTTPNGTWSVENGLASVNMTGDVTGVAQGNEVIRYTLPTGCYKAKAVVVNPLPAPIMGNMSICQGSNTTLTNTTALGVWSSSNSFIAFVSPSGNVVGNNPGFSIINYTLPTGCARNTTVVVNALPEPITGTAAVCAGNTTTLETASSGGVWSSGSAVANITQAGVVSGIAAGTSMVSYTNSFGCRRTRTVTVNALPSLITGEAAICPGTTAAMGNTATGGVWSSDNVMMVNVHPSTGAATATGADGMANVTYMLPTGCSRTKQIVVYPAVDAVTGNNTVCKGNTTALTTTATGGSWTSSSVTVATVDGTGMVTGTGAGVAAVAYVMPTGCRATMNVIVNPLPGNITGAAAVCEGSSIALGNSVAGGVWSSDDNDIATVTTTGMVGGVAAGSTTMKYELPTGCFVTKAIAVNALPLVKNVTGGGAYCAGGTGVAIGVDGSQAGTLYKLMLGTSPVITTVGTGGNVNYGNQLAAGTYMVTAVTPQGCMIDMNGTATVVMNPLVTPVVSMASDKGSSVCSGTTVVYTATGVDGGTTPTYEWSVNGTVVGSTSTYSFVPAHGDNVSIRFISSAACPAPASVTSAMSMTVLANLTPAVSLAVGPDDSVCEGSSAIYAAAAANGGSTPVYTWLVNGSIVPGETGAVFTNQPANNDLVQVRMTSNYACPTTNDVQSNTIKMHVDKQYTPVVQMTANPGSKVAEGTEVTFTATPLNAGDAPSFQWLVNESVIAGANTPVYKTSKLEDGDSVTCIVTANAKCANLSINSIVMEITPGTTSVGIGVIANSEVRLIPNPNMGSFNVNGTLTSKADQEVSFEVTNMLGQVIYSNTSVARNGVINERIELGKTLANGMYMLNMGVGAERKAFHFVVKQ